MSRKDLECLGSKRESLSNNPLLIAPELGKPIRRCVTLPPSDFTYGMKTVCFDGGVAQAVSSWHGHRRSPPSAGQQPKKDFIALNKLAAQSGLTTVHEQSQFRACNDIRVREKEVKGRDSASRGYNEDTTFGIATRPSTPLYQLLENRYQERWLQEKRAIEKKERQEISRRMLHGKVYETRASMMRHYSQPVEKPPLWKMKRFARIPANLNTFHSDQAKAKAYQYHASDSISRKGIFGHGIHQTA